MVTAWSLSETWVTGFRARGGTASDELRESHPVVAQADSRSNGSAV